MYWKNSAGTTAIKMKGKGKDKETPTPQKWARGYDSDSDNRSNNLSSNSNGMEEDANLDDSDCEEQEDPNRDQTSQEYCPRNTKDKAMARIFVRFFCLMTTNACPIVVSYGVLSLNKLADFKEERWKDTFIQLQKQHLCPDGMGRAMVLLLPQQDCICCATLT